MVPPSGASSVILSGNPNKQTTIRIHHLPDLMKLFVNIVLVAVTSALGQHHNKRKGNRQLEDSRSPLLRVEDECKILEQRRFVMAVIVNAVVFVENSGQLFFSLATTRTAMGPTSRLDPLTAGRASNSHNVCENYSLKR